MARTRATKAIQRNTTQYNSIQRNTTQYNATQRNTTRLTEAWENHTADREVDPTDFTLAFLDSTAADRRWEPTAKLQSPSLSLSSPLLRNSTECNRIIGDRPTTETTRDSGIKLISGHAYWTTRRHDTWQRGESDENGESGRRLPLALLSGLEG